MSALVCSNSADCQHVPAIGQSARKAVVQLWQPQLLPQSPWTSVTMTSKLFKACAVMQAVDCSSHCTCSWSRMHMVNAVTHAGLPAVAVMILNHYIITVTPAAHVMISLSCADGCKRLRENNAARCHQWYVVLYIRMYA